MQNHVRRNTSDVILSAENFPPTLYNFQSPRIKNYKGDFGGLADAQRTKNIKHSIKFWL